MRYTSELKNYLKANEDKIFNYESNDIKTINNKAYFDLEFNYVKSVCKGEWEPNLTLSGLSNIIDDLYNKELYYVKIYSTELKKVKVKKISNPRYIIGFVKKVLNTFNKKDIINFFKDYNLYFFVKLIERELLSFDDLFEYNDFCKVKPAYLKKLNKDDILKIIFNYFRFLNVREKLDFDIELISNLLDRFSIKFDEKNIKNIEIYFKDGLSEKLKYGLMKLILKYTELSNIIKIKDFILDNFKYVDSEQIYHYINNIIKNHQIYGDDYLNFAFELFEKLDEKNMIKILQSLISYASFNSKELLNISLPSEKILYKFVRKLLEQNIDESMLKEFTKLLLNHYNLNKKMIYDIIILFDEFKKCKIVDYIIDKMNLNRMDVIGYSPSVLNCVKMDEIINDLFNI
jgi:hypothetical protein